MPRACSGIQLGSEDGWIVAHKVSLGFEIDLGGWGEDAFPAVTDKRCILDVLKDISWQ